MMCIYWKSHILQYNVYIICLYVRVHIHLHVNKQLLNKDWSFLNSRYYPP